MSDAFDTDVAKKMPKTRPRHPWDIKPSNKGVPETIDELSIDGLSINKESTEASSLSGLPDRDYVDEHILPTLDPKTQLIYIKLYRLAYMHQDNITDFVGYTPIAKQCGISTKSVYRAVKELLSRQLISIADHNRSKGTRYRVGVPNFDDTTINK